MPASASSRSAGGRRRPRRASGPSSGTSSAGAPSPAAAQMLTRPSSSPSGSVSCVLLVFVFVLLSRWLSPLVWRAVCPRTPAQHASTQAARAPGAGRRPPRRDFCANEAVDRGVALRRHLNLPPPPCPSTLVHGLAPATTYRFAVSCVCAVDGELRESPPSLRSRPLEVPAVRGPVHKPTFLRVRRGDGVVGSSTPPRRSTRRTGRRASSSRRCSRTAWAPGRRPPRRRDQPRATTPPEPPTRRWTRAGRRRRRCSDPSRGPRRSV